MLTGMRAQLRQAVHAGAKPIEWLIRLESMLAVCDAARAEGVLSEEPTTILGIKVRGSWQLLAEGEGPLLICEGDETHRALLAMYPQPAA
jgi:hypothetical protein